jgi:hypothetical protein
MCIVNHFLRVASGLMLVATTLQMSCAVAASDNEQLIVLQDSQPYFQGSYGGYAGPWSTFFDASLVHGKDYLDTITLRPSSFPDGAVIDTRWPLTKPKNSGVWGYHALSFGDYDGGHPPKSVMPKQVRDIRRLSERFAFSYEGSDQFNLLNEFYLTSRAGEADAKVIEIGFFLHAPSSSVRFIEKGKKISAFNDSDGRLWKITRTNNYVTILPSGGKDLLQGEIDIRSVLKLLVDSGVITGSEWFNGIAFGTEPTEGAGHTSLTIERWRVDYE